MTVAEIITKYRKISTAAHTLIKRSNELIDNDQTVILMEEMIDENFSLLVSYSDSTMMLIDKSKGNYSIKSTWNVLNDDATDALNLIAKYIVCSSMA